ncbi:hypothetical protein GGR56DRAFT_679059 [Xylariaceae sp. FL0804]|nr:hypothetical protein GGR56DRAFT_679059 [Xylariaceae sp. FL0804]
MDMMTALTICLLGGILVIQYGHHWVVAAGALYWAFVSVLSGNCLLPSSFCPANEAVPHWDILVILLRVAGLACFFLGVVALVAYHNGERHAGRFATALIFTAMLLSGTPEASTRHPSSASSPGGGRGWLPKPSSPSDNGGSAWLPKQTVPTVTRTDIVPVVSELQDLMSTYKSIAQSPAVATNAWRDGFLDSKVMASAGLADVEHGSLWQGNLFHAIRYDVTGLRGHFSALSQWTPHCVDGSRESLPTGSEPFRSCSEKTRGLLKDAEDSLSTVEPWRFLSTDLRRGMVQLERSVEGLPPSALSPRRGVDSAELVTNPETTRHIAEALLAPGGFLDQRQPMGGPELMEKLERSKKLLTDVIAGYDGCIEPFAATLLAGGEGILAAASARRGLTSWLPMPNWLLRTAFDMGISLTDTPCVPQIQPGPDGDRPRSRVARLGELRNCLESGAAHIRWAHTILDHTVAVQRAYMQAEERRGKLARDLRNLLENNFVVVDWDAKRYAFAFPRPEEFIKDLDAAVEEVAGLFDFIVFFEGWVRTQEFGRYSNRAWSEEDERRRKLLLGDEEVRWGKFKSGAPSSEWVR